VSAQSPRQRTPWRRTAAAVAVVATLLVAAGVWPVLVAAGAGLGLFAVWFDHRHPRGRGGWKTAPMGSWAAVTCADNTWLVDERDADRRSTPDRPIKGPFSR
jgi:hypothetical protein